MPRITKIAFVVILLLLSLFIATSLVWPGSTYTYLIFSTFFTSLLYFALKRRGSAGYVFLAVVLWIGYWLKLSIHVLDPTLPWMEPIGLFDFSREAWDEVAIVSSCGAAGVLVAGLLLLPKVGAVKEKVIFDEGTSRFRIVSWTIGLGVLIGIIVLNEIFHIVHVPVPPPVLNVPWPLQGLFNWSLGGGALLLLMIPLYFEIAAGHFLRAVGLIISASLAVAVTIFSRGTVVFQSLIILVTLFVYRTFLPRPTAKQMVQFFMLIFLGVVLSVVLAQVRREAFSSSIQSSSIQSASMPTPAVQSPSSLSSYSVFLIFKLPIERWIGLEGVMAMSAHPEKGRELLMQAMKERRVLGVVDMYTHKIALSPTKDTKKVSYATPPSVFAFWYYSGSLLLVFIAVTVLAMILVAAERIILRVSRNPFLGAAVGIGGAIQVIHMGTGGLLIPGVIFATSLIFALLIGSWSRHYSIGRAV